MGGMSTKAIISLMLRKMNETAQISYGIDLFGKKVRLCTDTLQFRQLDGPLHDAAVIMVEAEDGTKYIGSVQRFFIEKPETIKYGNLWQRGTMVYTAWFYWQGNCMYVIALNMGRKRGIMKGDPVLPITQWTHYTLAHPNTKRITNSHRWQTWKTNTYGGVVNWFQHVIQYAALTMWEAVHTYHVQRIGNNILWWDQTTQKTWFIAQTPVQKEGTGFITYETRRYLIRSHDDLYLAMIRVFMYEPKRVKEDLEKFQRYLEFRAQVHVPKSVWTAVREYFKDPSTPKELVARGVLRVS